LNQPLVTVAMAVRNCETTVAAAVRSVLNQTFQDWEMLIVDDGSTDGTLAEVRRFQDARVSVLHDGHIRGLAARLNEAIALASSEFLARMDGDDVCYPERLGLQLEYLRSHADVDLVGGGVLVFEGDGQALGKRIPPSAHAAICRRPRGGFPMAHPTWAGKTQWFQRHGYSEAVLHSQDQDVLLRAFESSCYANIPAILLGYRDDLDLGKLLGSRCWLARVVLAEYLRRGQPLIGCLGVLEACLKGAVDIIAVLTGLRYRLLRHRARPITSEEASSWRKVWAAVADLKGTTRSSRGPE